MGELRALDINEMEMVVGGSSSISIGFGSCVSSSTSSFLTSATSTLATLIGFEAGLLAGVYNFTADLLNGASKSTLVSDISAIYTDAKTGAAVGSTSGLSAALALSNNTISAIQTALSSGTLTTIGFPPSTVSLA